LPARPVEKPDESSACGYEWSFEFRQSLFCLLAGIVPRLRFLRRRLGLTLKFKSSG
jgi:hypothetical protein